MPSSIRLVRVDGAKWASRLDELHRICLPGDDLYDTLKGHWWVAFEGPQAVAFAGYSPVSREPGYAYLCRSGVIPSHRGRGIQKRLIKVRVRHARAAGYRCLISATYFNPPSANSLIACGFRMYDPHTPWLDTGACYWRLPLSQ